MTFTLKNYLKLRGKRELKIFFLFSLSFEKMRRGGRRRTTTTITEKGSLEKDHRLSIAWNNKYRVSERWQTLLLSLLFLLYYSLVGTARKGRKLCKSSLLERLDLTEAKDTISHFQQLVNRSER